MLGDPGGGKSTFVNYLAFCLAMAQLEPEAGWLERLPGWTQGALLPVRVVLREFAASLPADLERGRAKHLWDFIAADLANSGRQADTAAVLRKTAEARGAIFLLDGLVLLKKAGWL